MSRANPLWGAPHIHVNYSSSASRSLSRRSLGICAATHCHHRKAGHVSQQPCRRHRGGRPFCPCNDRVLDPLLSCHRRAHGRRILVSFGVTESPSAEWISRQITQAFPWDRAPRYLIRGRDASYGLVLVQLLRGIGIRDRPIAFRSPWQNAYVERLIGSNRRGCLDRISNSVKRTCPGVWTHMPPTIMNPAVPSRDFLGGVHHQYCRM